MTARDFVFWLDGFTTNRHRLATEDFIRMRELLDEAITDLTDDDMDCNLRTATETQ